MDNSHNSADQTVTEAARPGASEGEAGAAGAAAGRPGTGPEAGKSAYTPQFNAGDVIDGRFAVVRFIARGGMGEVYEVEDRQLRGVHVALKTILSQYAADTVMRQRFEREVLNAREVAHPNICPMYDLGHWHRPGGELTYLTMKLLPGESLAARLVRQGRLTGEEALAIMRQVGAGIAAAHEAGILHRDIKAANIMLDGAGGQVLAWVTDFGLARAALEEETALTIHGVVGTPGFMAPEIFYGGTQTRASDVYALGVVAHQMLTGWLPQIAMRPGKSGKASLGAAEIPEGWKRFVEGCLKHDVGERFKTVEEAMRWLPASVERAVVGAARGEWLSRRRLLALGAGASAAVAGAAWLEWGHVLNWVDPLPATRFVALMALPADRTPALLATVLESIGQRLARAEAYVTNLLIITPRDRPGQGQAIDSPAKTENALGANLVLATSLEESIGQARLDMRLLDAHSQRVMRRSIVECARREIGGLAEKAAHEAALLLQLPNKDVQLSDPEELRSVPAEVFQAYSEAEQLVNQPNNAGLKQAIDKYQQALDMDGHFALGYARLAIAYVRQFYVTKEPANIDLASTNAASALRYNPRSAMGMVGRGLVESMQGRLDAAMADFAQAQQADPGNPEILYHKVWALEHMGQMKEAEQAYREILAERPNFWPAYNNLGVLLTRAAKYDEAAKAFAKAGAAAPKVALPMANLAQTYIELGRRDDARAALNESLARGENEDAYMALGDMDFEDGKYKEALNDYTRAGSLDPRNHLIQRNIGDCYTMLGNAAMVKEAYGRAERLLAPLLQMNPRDALGWANLAFYNAKIGDRAAAEEDLKNAREHGAYEGNQVAARFMIVQALAVLGRKGEALELLLKCMDEGLSAPEVDLAVDLKELRGTAAYQAKVKRLKRG